MTDEHHDEDWSPEKERDEDPAKLARELFKKAEKMISTPLQLAPPGPFIGVAFDTTFHARKISNGWIVSHLALEGDGRTSHRETFITVEKKGAPLESLFFQHIEAVNKIERGGA